MKHYYALVLFILCFLFWNNDCFAQSSVTIWKNGETTIIDVPDSVKFLKDKNTNNKSVSIWKNGSPTFISIPDSVSFWNSYAIINNIDNNEGESPEPTAEEIHIMKLSSNEEEASEIVYSEADSLEYDALAQEVLSLFVNEESDDDYSMSRKKVNEDELAQEAIRENGKNIFEGKGVKIEQQDWNSGQWGKTQYGGFETFYNTYEKYGRRYLLVVFYHKGGFPNTKRAYLKLGQVNSGKILPPHEGEEPGYVTVGPRKEFATISVCIDNYIKPYGCVNFFPLLITEGTNARNYLNPIMVKSHPLVPNDWRRYEYSREFGKINGVSLYANTSDAVVRKTGKYNMAGDLEHKFQCVELCKRYIKDFYKNIKRTSSWGHAINWPDNRKYEDVDKGAYLVFDNNGKQQVREGDILVWDYDTYGHIGVVIKTTEKYISVAHQNGGDGSTADPIGSTLKYENGIIKDIKPGKNTSPIFASSWPISAIIRVDHPNEHASSSSEVFLTASTTNMDFRDTEVGKSDKKSFWIKKTGDGTLDITSMSPSRGNAFSIDVEKCKIDHNNRVYFNVTFTPTEAGIHEDRIIIKSNAKDNPQWIIKLKGTAKGGTPANIALSTKSVSLNIGETTTVNVTSGSGSYSVSDYDKKVVDVSVKGKVITIKALSGGNTSIKVTDTNTKKTAEVAVKVAYPNIALSTKELNLSIGETKQFEVTSGSGSYSVSGYDKKVVNVSLKGKVITVKALTSGNTSIKVTDTNSNKTAEVAVKVAYPNIALSTKELNLTVGETKQFEVTSGSGSYSVSGYNTKVVEVSVKGKVVTVKALSDGNTSIKVTDTNSKKTAEVAVKVNKVSYPDVALSTKELNLTVGETKQFEVTSGTGSYSVSGYDTKVVEVSVKGKVITVKALSDGNTSIKVTDTNSKKTAEVAVKVNKLSYPDITLSTQVIYMNVGETKQIEVTSGSGSYSVWVYAPELVDIKVNGNIITIKGLAEGRTAARAIDNISGKEKPFGIQISVPSAYDKDAVDLGLSVKWAKMNVGAVSEEDCGEHYAWGETESKSYFSWSSYDFCNGTSSTITKYNSHDGKTTLDPSDDVANVIMGGNWRTPTLAELEELVNRCTWTQETLNGVNGARVTGPNGKSIFLPYGGAMYEDQLSHYDMTGYYYASTLSSDGEQYVPALVCFGNKQEFVGHARYFGLSIRGVLSK